MKKVIIIFLLIFLSYAFAYDIGLYKIDQTLSAEQAKEFIKKYNARPSQPWVVPTEKDIPSGEEGEKIREAIQLLTHTSQYIGPNAPNVKSRYLETNLNCVNCHQAGPSGLPGTKKYSLPWVDVIYDYPKLNTKTMKIMSLEERVITMAGKGKVKFPADSREMKLIINYFHWLDQFAVPGKQMEGTGLYHITLARAANPVAGKKVYVQQCAQCHMANAEGMKQPKFDEGAGYVFPPIAGNDTFDDSSHMAMIPILASIIYVNMPYQQATYDHPKLSIGEAYDLASYLVTLPRNQNPGRINSFPNPALRPDSYVIPEYFPTYDEYLKKRFGPFKTPYSE